jgi:hypothetical protein
MVLKQVFGEVRTVAGDMGPQTARFALFEVSAIVIKERLNVAFTYNNSEHLEAVIVNWEQGVVAESGLWSGCFQGEDILISSRYPPLSSKNALMLLSPTTTKCSIRALFAAGFS